MRRELKRSGNNILFVVQQRKGIDPNFFHILSVHNELLFCAGEVVSTGPTKRVNI